MNFFFILMNNEIDKCAFLSKFKNFLIPIYVYTTNHKISSFASENCISGVPHFFDIYCEVPENINYNTRNIFILDNMKEVKYVSNKFNIIIKHFDFELFI